MASPSPPILGEAIDDLSDFSDPETPLATLNHSHGNLLPFRLWYFLAFAGMACINPFLVLYYHRTGLSEGQIGILLALQPAMAVPMGPVWGFLVDYTKNAKGVLIFTLVGSTICRFLVGWTTTFWQLFSVICLSYAIGAPCSVLVDVMALKALSDETDYGKLRLWGAVGWGMASPLAGLLIQVTNIHAIFYCHLALMAVAVIVSTQLEDYKDTVGSTQKKLTTTELFTTMQELFSRASVVAFFGVVIVMGMALGCMGSYVFLYIEELGGSTTLMGLTLTVMCIAEIPAMYLSGGAVRLVGVVGVLCIVLSCNVVRLLYYSFVWNPWMILPIELLHGITFGWGFSIGTMHAGFIAPPGLAATVQVLFNSALFSVGSGLGSLVSGIVYQHFGAVFLFRTMACVVFTTLLFFVSFNSSTLKPSSSTQPLLTVES